MDTLLAKDDMADLDDADLEPVADEDWEQAAAAVAEPGEPGLDAVARRRAGEEDRDADDEDEGAGACDHACRGNAARPGSCCLLNAVGPAAAEEQQAGRAAAAAALAGEFTAVAVPVASGPLEGGEELSAGL